MITAMLIIAALVVSHAAAIGLGGWLHYRFGATVVNTAKVLEAAVSASKK